MPTPICPACINDFIKSEGIEELGTELEDYTTKECKPELCEEHKYRNFFKENIKVLQLINE